MYLFFNCIAVCATCKVKKKNESQLPLMKIIFVIFSRLKWKYVKIMEVQEVTMEVQEESVQSLSNRPIP